ncbi:LacI family DNA-binding transcriptional regulator [Bacillus sp. REN16]|uniref:LacI family DNA-binding transcriptional regulator n=1 Tax=Bacillus sp. REN16 TaxID=2887296 RepID=UPI001E4AAAC0|nr:LacI family DNA-binding transcriptional regulator [Bacillus sp. REN16]MCC3356363.1 LacI family transcriptional regulator [Bacillus sp. REN16]
MVTMKEIARLANVSSATVSRVLNNSGYVSDDVRKRILKIINETGYIPSEHAKALRTKQSNVIGVILPKLSTETASRIVNGISEELAKHGYQILLTNTNLDPEKEIEYVKLLKSKQVDGIILLATNRGEDLLNEIKKLRIPFVATGQEMEGIPSVINNNFQAAKDITNLLIEKGHRNIAFIGVDEVDYEVGYKRKAGYLAALEENQLPVFHKWIGKADFSIESGYATAKQIFSVSSESPTAIVAVTDRLAIGAMEYLKEQGLEVPSDVALAGMGASVLSKYVVPKLTTVDLLSEHTGAEAAKTLLGILQEGISLEKKQIEYRLIIRDSI